MKITLTPMRHDAHLTVHRSGDVLTINGEAFDFSPMPEGATLPREAVACEWLASDVTRANGQLGLTLILPHGPEAPRAVLFPETITVTGDGPVRLPAGTMEDGQ